MSIIDQAATILMREEPCQALISLATQVSIRTLRGGNEIVELPFDLPAGATFALMRAADLECHPKRDDGGQRGDERTPCDVE
jgi:hypothetical protein